MSVKLFYEQHKFVGWKIFTKTLNKFTEVEVCELLIYMVGTNLVKMYVTSLRIIQFYKQLFSTRLDLIPTNGEKIDRGKKSRENFAREKMQFLFFYPYWYCIDTI